MGGARGREKYGWLATVNFRTTLARNGGGANLLLLAGMQAISASRVGKLLL